MDRRRGCTRLLCEGMLFLMFFTMMVVSCVVLLAAVVNLTRSNAEVITILEEVSNHVQKQALIQDGAATAAAQAYLKELQYVCKGGFEANTVTFLFQVFSIALVSAGVYLLQRSKENLGEAEDRISAVEVKALEATEKVGMADERASQVQAELDGILQIAGQANQRTGLLVRMAMSDNSSATISRDLSTAFYMSCLGQVMAESDAIQNIMPLVREALRQANSDLVHAMENKVGISQSQYVAFLDWALGTIDNLRNTHVAASTDLAGVMVIAESCRDILQRTDFVSWHEEIANQIPRT